MGTLAHHKFLICDTTCVLDADIAKYKLEYDDPTFMYGMTTPWLSLLDRQFIDSTIEICGAVRMGVPTNLREKVWPFLMKHCSPQTKSQCYISSLEYRKLLQMYSKYDDAIRPDVG